MSEEAAGHSMDLDLTVKVKLSATLCHGRVNKDSPYGVERIEHKDVRVMKMIVADKSDITGVSVGDDLVDSGLGAQIIAEITLSMPDMFSWPDLAATLPPTGPKFKDSTVLQTPVMPPIAVGRSSDVKTPVRVAYNLRARKVLFKASTPTPGNRVRKLSKALKGLNLPAQQQKGPGAKRAERAVEKVKRKLGKDDSRVPMRFQNTRFTKMVERSGLAAALEFHGSAHTKKIKARLEKVAEKRWSSIGGQVTEDAKMDAITKAFANF